MSTPPPKPEGPDPRSGHEIRSLYYVPTLREAFATVFKNMFRSK